MVNAEILCIGNPLVDVFAQGDEQLCTRAGIGEPVQHVEIEKLSPILETVKISTKVSGGGAANVAKIAGYLGAKTGFIGALGKPGNSETDDGKTGQTDEMGRLFEKDLAAAGVELKLALKPSPTGICLHLATKEKTHIAASPSAAMEFSENDISRQDLQRARVVVIDGFMLERSELVEHIFREAGRSVLVLDVSSPFIARYRAEKILSYAKQFPLILFMNRTEAETLFKRLSAVFSPANDDGSLFPKENPDRRTRRRASFDRRKSELLFRMICSFFKNFTREKTMPVIVLKLGHDGAMVFAGGTIIQSKTLAVSPLETTGAGDAFCAAFLLAWIRNKSLPECASLGNRAARIILGVPGTSVSREQLAELARAMG